jgi:hypothetical protein
VVLAGVDDCRKVRIERDVRCPVDKSAFAKILESTFRALNGAQQSMRTIRMGHQCTYEPCLRQGALDQHIAHEMPRKGTSGKGLRYDAGHSCALIREAAHAQVGLREPINADAISISWFAVDSQSFSESFHARARACQRLAKDGGARSRYAQDPKRATCRALGNSYHTGVVGRHGIYAGAIRAQPRRPYSILAQAIDAGETDNSAFAKYAESCITLATHPSAVAAALSENAVVQLTFALHAWTAGARSHHSYTRARPQANDAPAAVDTDPAQTNAGTARPALASDTLDADADAVCSIAGTLDCRHRVQWRKMSIACVADHSWPDLQDNVSHIVVAIVYLADELSLPVVEVLVF